MLNLHSGELIEWSDLHKAAIVFAVLAIVLVTSNSVFGQASLSMSTQFTQPAYLDETMTIWVTVQNQASIPFEVMSLTVSLDWYQTLTGDTPRVLQAGEKSSWEFDNVNIPSATWTGKHSFDASATGGFADSSGGWSNQLSSPVTTTTNFGVQQQKPEQQGSWTCSQNGCAGFTEAGYTTCGQGLCVSQGGPGLPQITVNNGPDFSGPVIAILVMLVIVIAVPLLLLDYRKTKRPKRQST
jgi:hypothetical protein